MRIIKISLALLILTGIYPVLFAQDFKGKTQAVNIAPAQDKLIVGENLAYSVEWLGIHAIKINLSVKELKNIIGHECYHVEATAEPNNFFRIFHDVEYRVDTYIDIKTFLPVLFEKTKREKNTVTKMVIEFNHEKKEAKVTTDRTTVVKITPSTQDLLSGLCYFRKLNIKEGEKFPINVLYEQKSWPVIITVKGAFLKDIRKKGTFPVIELSPNGDLINYILGKRNILVYFTADSSRIPLLFTLNTKFGILRGALRDRPR